MTFVSSMRSVLKQKSFDVNDNLCFDVQLTRTQGTGGANDTVGYIYCVVSIQRNTTRTHKMFTKTFSGEDGERPAQELYDSIHSNTVAKIWTQWKKVWEQ